MSARPTDDDLDDPAETGRCGCLIPEIEDDEGGGENDGDE